MTDEKIDNIISKSKMLKKLKSELFMSQVQRQLDRAKINKSHDFVQPKHIILTSNLVSIPKTKNQLLNNLYKKLHSSQSALKVKALIVLHACLRKNFDEDVCELLMNEDVSNENSNPGKDDKANLQAYIRKNVIDFYLLYLKKACMNKDSLVYIRKFTRKQTYTEFYDSEDLKHEQNIEIVTHGFKILNLCNYILQSQQMFNKMGRYHIEYQQILSMYMQLLEDLNLFNNYIKHSVRIILDRMNQNKNSVEECANFFKLNSSIGLDNIKIDRMKKDKSLTSSTQVETGKIALEELNTKCNADQVEEIKHYFLYVNECQKLSDRLYEYYHNRYYYKVLRSLIIFPSFLTIENKEYSRIKKKTKKIDRNLVNLVKRSKYEGEMSMIGDTIRTQPNMGMKTTINRTLCYDRGHLTEFGQQQEEQVDPYRNISHNFIHDKMEEEVQQVQDL